MEIAIITHDEKQIWFSFLIKQLFYKTRKINSLQLEQLEVKQRGDESKKISFQDQLR
jgi:hypothetical protein